MTVSIGIAGIMVVRFQAPPFFAVMAILANVAGWFYSAPPVRLSARGAGELVVAVSTGWIIPSAGYLVVRGRFDPLFLFCTIPFMLYGLMLSLSLEAPDSEVDRPKRRNLVVRKGLRVTVFSIVLTSAVASVLFLSYAWLMITSVIDLRMITVFSLIPLAAGLFGAYAFFWETTNLNRISTLNVMSLFAFNLLFNGYCFYLLALS
jgi:1,4-dihydroxy-2-naphthoate octaprenyltransferase